MGRQCCCVREVYARFAASVVSLQLSTIRACEAGIRWLNPMWRENEQDLRQMKRVGLSYDWDRELSTTDPDYYRWTQWIFLKLFERGLAYVAEVPVNWCPALGTVLANEEIIDGKSEVGGFPVVRRPMRQWMLRITAYAEKLLNDLGTIDWTD